MLFRGTRAIRQLLSVDELEAQDAGRAGTADLWDWHCRIVATGRSRSLLFTHTLTLYSVIVVGRIQRSRLGFGAAFRAALRKTAGADGFGQTEINRLIDGDFDNFACSRGKSIIGSMNDFTRMIKWRILDAGNLQRVDLFETLSDLNEAPMGAIGMRSPSEMLRDLLRPGETFGKEAAGPD